MIGKTIKGKYKLTIKLYEGNELSLRLGDRG